MTARAKAWLIPGGLVLLVACALAPRLSLRRTDAPPRPPSPLSPGPAHAAPADPAVQPRFVDTHETAGLTAAHVSGAEGKFRLVETMGGGVALFDHDADGWLDILVVGGCPLPLDPARLQPSARLYRNQRDGTFADVTMRAGIRFNGYGQGIAVGDHDGDGHLDFYLSALGAGALYRNRGDGTFADVTARAGVAGAGWATSCAFADLDGDGDLDLYVCHYLADTIDARGEPTVNCNATPGRLGYCPPEAFAAEPDVLYRNNGDGTFSDVSKSSGIALTAGKGLGLAVADFDDDGKLDVFVANDQTPNFLFRNRGGLTFEEVATRWGVAYSESGQLRSGMGVALGDYDGDGRPDILVTNFYEEGDTLYRNAGPGDFQVTTALARLAAPSRGTLGFGTLFLDLDNDGHLDLFVTNGHLNDVRPLGMPYQMPPQLFLNDGRGRFLDTAAQAGAYLRSAWLGRGAAAGDLDNDGDEDLVVSHLGRPPAVLMNQTAPRGRFLSLDLQPRRGGAPSVGARVSAVVGGRTMVRVVAGGTSYLSSGDPRVRLGLGQAARIERLEVAWPSGLRQQWTDVAADQFLRVREGNPGLLPAAGASNRTSP